MTKFIKEMFKGLVVYFCVLLLPSISYAADEKTFPFRTEKLSICKANSKTECVELTYNGLELVVNKDTKFEKKITVNDAAKLQTVSVVGDANFGLKSGTEDSYLTKIEKSGQLNGQAGKFSNITVNRIIAPDSSTLLIASNTNFEKAIKMGETKTWINTAGSYYHVGRKLYMGSDYHIYYEGTETKPNF